jgi:hypothetical protein
MAYEKCVQRIERLRLEFSPGVFTDVLKMWIDDLDRVKTWM